MTGKLEMKGRAWTRSRVDELLGAAADLVEAVERYTVQVPGEFLHRSDLLQVKDRLARLLR